MKRHDPTQSMWDEALALLDHADRLHRQFFQLEQHRNAAPTWQPPVDVLETEREILIVVALPGVKAEQLFLTIEGGTVVVRGNRVLPSLRDAARIRRLEIPYGQFERRIDLPPGQFQLGQRILQDGCLTLTLDKLR